MRLPELDTDMRPMQPLERLRHDAYLARRTRDELSVQPIDDTALLCILSAVQGSDQLCKPTLDRLVRQCAALRLRARVLLCLNNGAVFPPGTLGGLDADVRQTWLEPKVSPREPAMIHTASRHSIDEALTSADQHVLMLRQPASDAAAGKIRALNDVSGLVFDALERGQRMPKHTLLLDVESHFMETPAEGEKPDLSTNGLATLLATLSTGGDIAGARSWSTAFTEHVLEGLMPDFAIPVSPIHARINRVHGTPGHAWLTGGGILGKSEHMLSLLRTVSRYPGVRAEDGAMDRVGRCAGFAIDIAQEATVTNRCPPDTEHEAALKQIARWRATKEDLDAFYGKDDAGAGLEPSFRRKLLEFARHYLRPTRFIEGVRVARDNRRANKRVPQLRGSVLDGNATW